MKARFNFIFLFLALVILVLSIVLYKEFETAKEKIYNKIFEKTYLNLKALSQNYENYIKKLLPKNQDWYLYLKTHPKIQKNIEEVLSILSTKDVKYIYLLEKKEKFIFLADGSKEDKACFGETFTPLNIKEFEKTTSHYFFHKRLKSIWVTYIYPVKKDVILVVDVPLSLLNYIKSILEKLNYNIKSILIFIFVMILLLLIFSYFDKKRELEKEKLLKQLQETNEELENKVKEKLKEIRQKDAMLLNQSKLASLGEMLNMIAHQWRQPLNAISSYAVRMELEANFKDVSKEEVIDFAKYVQFQTKNMSEIINDFMNFAKPEEKQEFYLKEIVDEVLKMVKAQLNSYNINIEVNIDNTKLNSYKKDMIHILLNLIANSKDVLIERKVKNPTIKIYNEKNKIFVEDNGGGVEDDIKDKIFDPYFTTKFEGKGTGLGLYMSKKIANEKLNGDLYFENTKEGAKFILVIGK